MIIVAGTGSIRPADHSAGFAALHKMSAVTQSEAGCLEYRFAVSLDDPEGIDVFECWADQAALDAHLASAHTVEFGEALAQFMAPDSLRLTRYEVSDSAPFPAAAEVEVEDEGAGEAD